MDKKNTLLLTVIAVATLLVAVVGATFAFFSLQVSGNATTTATVNTGKVGTVTISGGSKTLTLKVTPEDMAKPSEEKDIYYYAVEGSGTPKDTGGIWEKQDAESGSAPKGTNVVLGTATLSNGGENDSYTCGFKVTITANKGESLKKFQSGDLVLTIGGSGISENAASSSDPNSVIINDFSSFESSKILHGQFTLNDGTPEDIANATLYLVNKKAGENTEGQQNYLAGLDVTLTLTLEAEGECTIDSTPAIPGA